MNASIHRGLGLFGTILGSILLVSAAPASAPKPDACRSLLPRLVRELVEKKYPHARLVSVDDYSDEDVKSFREQKQPCPGAAIADANGDGRKDYGFLALTQRHVLVLVALSQPGGSWQIELLTDWGNEGVGGVFSPNIYVSETPAGRYRDMFTEEHAPSEYVPVPGRAKEFRARWPGFVTGGIESSGVAYFFDGHRWVHLWISD
jgi:hypothetical protein